MLGKTEQIHFCDRRNRPAGGRERFVRLTRATRELLSQPLDREIGLNWALPPELFHAHFDSKYSQVDLGTNLAPP